MALLEKLTDFQLVKKFPAFYGTRRFITAFTSAFYVNVLQQDTFLRWGVFSSSPNPQGGGLPLVSCLATLHIGDRSSIHNLRTHCAVVTGTHLSRAMCIRVQITPGLYDNHVPESGHRNWNFCYSFVPFILMEIYIIYWNFNNVYLRCLLIFLLKK